VANYRPPNNSRTSLNVAFIINDLSGGGAEKALTLLAGYLARNGSSVTIVTLNDGIDRYSAGERVARIHLESRRVCRGWGRVLLLPLQAAELTRVLRRLKPDVCVSFLPRANAAHVMTRAFGNRAPAIATEQVASRHAYPSNSPADRVMRWLIRTCYPRADAVFPSSAGVRDGLLEFGVSPERMHVVYNPVDISGVRALAAEAGTPGPDVDVPTVINVGRLVEQKDHHTLLRAFARVRNRHAARLVLLGQGPLQQELHRLARELNIDDAVVFAGWQDNPYRWLARADLFALSSRYEGFGNVIVEAMACGLPVISTDCPSGPHEILGGGEFGMLTPVGDVDALAAATEAMVSDPQRRQAFAARSVRRAEDFDIGVVGAGYQRLLQDVIEGPSSGRVALEGVGVRTGSA
jgi:glycosyltransferase involved in cell wall biosynthesis